MQFTLLRFSVGMVVLGATAIAAESTAKPVTAPSQPTKGSSPSTASQKGATATLQIDKDAVIVNDTGPTPAKPAVDDKAPTKPKNPVAEAAAAQEAEKTRLADEASAFARGEGERYARRQKAYEAARAVSRSSTESVKSASIAQMTLPDGRVIVVADGARTTFPNKAAADAHVAGIRRAELERPIVLGTAPKK